MTFDEAHAALWARHEDIQSKLAQRITGANPKVNQTSNKDFPWDTASDWESDLLKWAAVRDATRAGQKNVTVVSATKRYSNATEYINAGLLWTTGSALYTARLAAYVRALPEGTQIYVYDGSESEYLVTVLRRDGVEYRTARGIRGASDTKMTKNGQEVDVVIEGSEDESLFKTILATRKALRVLPVFTNVRDVEALRSGEPAPRVWDLTGWLAEKGDPFLLPCNAVAPNI